MKKACITIISVGNCAFSLVQYEQFQNDTQKTKIKLKIMGQSNK